MTAITSIMDRRISGVINDTGRPDPLSPADRARMTELLRQRDVFCPEEELAEIDREIIAIATGEIATPQMTATQMASRLKLPASLTRQAAGEALAALADLGCDLAYYGQPYDVAAMLSLLDEGQALSLWDVKGSHPGIRYDTPGDLMYVQGPGAAMVIIRDDLRERLRNYPAIIVSVREDDAAGR